MQEEKSIRVDPFTGALLQSNFLGEGDSLRDDLARCTYAGMLHDNERHSKYFAALRKAVKDIHAQGKAVNALDIGTGTGILAMMAAQAGAERVTAAEVFPPMAMIAEKVINQNNLSEKIVVISKDSTDMKVGPGGDMDQRANLLVSEVFDTELIGEGVLPILRHAHQHLLEEGCIVIPHHADVFIQLIDSPWLLKMNRVSQINLSSTNNIELPTPWASSYPAHDVLSGAVPDLRTLSEPYALIKLNLSGPLLHTEVTESLRGGVTRERHTIRATSTGVAHAVLLWWSLQLDADSEIHLSMAPAWALGSANESVWRDHWVQAVYHLPEPLQVEYGQEVHMSVSYDDYSFWFDASLEKNQTIPRSPAVNSCMAMSLSPQRRAQMNSSMLATFLSALSKMDKELVHVVVVGDFSLLPLVALKAGARKVSVLDDVSLRQQLGILEVFAANGAGCGSVQFIDRKVEEADAETLKLLGDVTLVLGEPSCSPGVFPWDHLLFWVETNHIRNCLHIDIPTCPSSARIKAIAVELEHLYHSRSPVVMIEGFDLSYFDKVIEHLTCPGYSPEHGQLFLMHPYPMWEYSAYALSEPFSIMDLDLASETHDIKSVQSYTLTREGTFHAVVAWVEWYCGDQLLWSSGLLEQASSEIEHVTASESPRQRLQWTNCSKQGVCFSPAPCPVLPGDRLHCTAVFSCAERELKLRTAIATAIDTDRRPATERAHSQGKLPRLSVI